MKIEQEDDDIEIDVCMSCGRYFGYSQSLKNIWENRVYKRPGEIMAQLCFRCMEREYGR